MSTLVRKDGRPRRLVPVEVFNSAEQFGASGLLITMGVYFAFRLDLGNGFAGAQLSPDGTAGVRLVPGDPETMLGAAAFGTVGQALRMAQAEGWQMRGMVARCPQCQGMHRPS